jgi:prepilin-type processing-associated H-X9-DG protein
LTSAQLSDKTTCVETQHEAEQRLHVFPHCYSNTNWNFSFGFRSWHPAGSNFLLADGSVTFLNDDVNYVIYQAYGGRNDGKPVKE